MITKRAGLFFGLFILFSLFLSGCAPITRADQTSSDRTVDVLPGHSIGQTFVAGYRGLSAIDVFITPQSSGQKLTLTLYADPFRKQRLAAESLTVDSLDGGGYQRFSFPVQQNSTKKSYYFDIQVEGGAAVAVSAAPGDVYLDGSLYQDNNPVDGQISFRLAYDRVQLGLGLLLEFVGWGGYFLLGGFIYVLPGWGLLSLLLGDLWTRRRWAEKLALSVGVGLALYPTLLLWADLVHLRLGSFFVWIPAGLAFVYLLWKNRAGLQRLRRPNFQLKWHDLGSDFAFVVLLGVILFMRFWVIRGIDVPMWGDSYQHTMIAQLIVDNHGLFDSWAPYEPYRSLTVQYGFPAAAAAWMWLTGVSSTQAVLVFSQLLNFYAILALYPLAVQWARGNRWAGNAALLIGGLFHVMPAYFVNWGRFAQLMGQTILPVALCLVWYWLENPRSRWKPLIVNGLAVTEMLLSYYRMAFYYASFFPALLIILWLSGPFGRNWHNWKTGLLKLAGLALLCGILILPWIPNVSGSTLSNQIETGIVSETPLQSVIKDYATWVGYHYYTTDLLLMLSAGTLLVGLFLKRWEVIGIFVWTALVIAVKAGSLIHLPGANMIQSVVVMISLYIFVSIGASWLVGLLAEQVASRFRMAGTILCLALFMGFAFYGAIHQRKVADPRAFAIAVSPDLRAMDWIRANTPAESRFLVEGFRAFNGLAAVGSDGGWWIPLLTERLNTMPPLYALGNERSDPPDYTQRVISLVKKLETYTPVDSAMWPDLCQWGIKYIYVGQQQGKASAQKFQLFSPNLTSPQGILSLVYAQDRVRIYSVSSDICQGQAHR